MIKLSIIHGVALTPYNSGDRLCKASNNHIKIDSKVTNRFEIEQAIKQA